MFIATQFDAYRSSQEYCSCAAEATVNGSFDSVAAVALFPKARGLSVDPQVRDRIRVYSSAVEGGYDDVAYAASDGGVGQIHLFDKGCAMASVRSVARAVLAAKPRA